MITKSRAAAKNLGEVKKDDNGSLSTSKKDNDSVPTNESTKKTIVKFICDYDVAEQICDMDHNDMDKKSTTKSSFRAEPKSRGDKRPRSSSSEESVGEPSKRTNLSRSRSRDVETPEGNSVSASPLKAELLNLREENIKLRQELKQLSDKCEDQERDIIESEKKYKISDNAKILTFNKVLSLQKDLRSEQQRAAEAEQMVKQLTSKLEQNTGEPDAEKERLKTDISMLRNDLAKLSRELESEKTAVTTLNEELSEKRTELDEKKVKLEDFDEELLKTVIENDEIKKGNERLKAEVNTLKTHIKIVSDKLRSKFTENDTAKTTYADKIADLEEKNRKLQDDLNAQTSLVFKKEEKEKSQEDLISKLRDGLASQGKHIKQLEAKVSHLTNQLNQKIEMSREKDAELEASAKELNKLDRDVLEKMDELAKEKKEKKQVEDEVAKLKVFLKNAVKSFKEAKSKLAAKDKLLAEQDKDLVEKNKQLIEKLAARDKKLAVIDKELAEKNKELTEKDINLATRDKKLVAKEKELAEKDKVLSEKKKELAEKDLKLMSRDKKIAEGDKMLCEMNKGLTEKDLELATRDKQLVAKNKELAAKDSELAERNSLLSLKDSELQEKNSEIMLKDSELLAKTYELSMRESQLSTKANELAAKDTQLATKANELATKNAQLEAKDAQQMAKANELSTREAYLSANERATKEGNTQSQEDPKAAEEIARLKRKIKALRLVIKGYIEDEEESRRDEGVKVEQPCIKQEQTGLQIKEETATTTEVAQIEESNPEGIAIDSVHSIIGATSGSSGGKPSANNIVEQDAREERSIQSSGVIDANIGESNISNSEIESDGCTGELGASSRDLGACMEEPGSIIEDLARLNGSDENSTGLALAEAPDEQVDAGAALGAAAAVAAVAADEGIVAKASDATDASAYAAANASAVDNDYETRLNRFRIDLIHSIKTNIACTLTECGMRNVQHCPACSVKMARCIRKVMKRANSFAFQNSLNPEDIIAVLNEVASINDLTIVNA